jgi:CRP-like cAMP-binding protein
LSVVIPTKEKKVEKYFEILLNCPLFRGLETSDFQPTMECFDGKIIKVSANSPIFLAGEPAKSVGVLLSGAAQIIKEDYYGNRSIIGALEPSELFAEVFACAKLPTLPVSVVAQKDSAVLLLNLGKLLTLCGQNCHFHNLLIRNLLQVMAQKNLALSQKIEYMSQKTTRDKVTAYLLEQAKLKKSSEFVIPFDRQALADYLGVDRSAMSAEISRLKKEGQLDTKGSWFRLEAM